MLLNFLKVIMNMSILIQFNRCRNFKGECHQTFILCQVLLGKKSINHWSDSLQMIFRELWQKENQNQIKVFANHFCGYADTCLYVSGCGFLGEVKRLPRQLEGFKSIQRLSSLWKICFTTRHVQQLLPFQFKKCFPTYKLLKNLKVVCWFSFYFGVRRTQVRLHVVFLKDF